ncbi:MAG: enoyl-CoA hydratase/isomerase family protein, partial [Elusimicrobia bacterium]|nr:enoyl-CoA hydratase/isomerase family protein [Elusimicrobiota bacterium]
AREDSSVVVLRGEGRAFCAGGDLGFIADCRRRPQAALARRMRAFYGSFLSIRELPQVTIARVQGAAVGAGLCLALACDLRVVSKDARLGFNFVRLGLNPGMAAWPLARGLFGEARARELLLSGRFFTGRQLRQWGAAGAAAGPRALDQAVSRLVLELRGLSKPALALLKGEMRLEEPLTRCLAFEAAGQARCLRGPDILEGLSAVRQRRAPRFCR